MTSTNAPDTYSFFFANLNHDVRGRCQSRHPRMDSEWWHLVECRHAHRLLRRIDRRAECGSPNTVSLYATTGTSGGSRPGQRQFADRRHIHVQQRQDRHRHVWGDDHFGHRHRRLWIRRRRVRTASRGRHPGLDHFMPARRPAHHRPSPSRPNTAAAPMPAKRTPATRARSPSLRAIRRPPGSGLPSNYTFTAGNNGVATFTNGVTLKTAGSQTITATDHGTQGFSSATVAVSPRTPPPIGRLGPRRFDVGHRLQRHRHGPRSIRQHDSRLHRHGQLLRRRQPARLCRPLTRSSLATTARTPLPVASRCKPPARPTGTNETITATDSGNSISGSAIVDDYVVSPFTAGDFLVYRVGTGSTNLSGVIGSRLSR